MSIDAVMIGILNREYERAVDEPASEEKVVDTRQINQRFYGTWERF